LEALAASWLRTDDVRRLDIPTNLATATRSAAPAEMPYAVYAPASGRGYVVLATAEAQTPLLGFSETGRFDVRTAPPALLELLAATADVPSTHLSRAAASGASTEAFTTESDDEAETDSVLTIAPLLGRIAFGQDAPYYNRCPLVGGERTLTGCVATAMAEVMAYYRYPEQMTGDPISYTVDSTDVSVSWNTATTFFRWDDILDAYPVAYEAPTGADSLGTADFGASQLHLDADNYLTLESLCIYTQTPFAGTIQLFLATDVGQPVGIVGNPMHFELSPGYMYKQWHFWPTTLPGISEDLPDGDYRLYAALRAEGDTQWQVIGSTSANSSLLKDQPVYIPLHKQGRTYTIEGQTFDVAYTQAQGEAVATLCAAAGAAAHASYAVEATGAWTEDMTMGLYRNFGYDDGMQYIFWNYVPPTATVEAELLAELQAGRPVLAAGSNVYGVAHQFVIDGVQQRDSLLYFHFNWGWDGYDNGYFVLNLDHRYLDGPEVNEFTYYFDYVLGMKPDDGRVSPIQLLTGDVTATLMHTKTGKAYLRIGDVEVINGSPRTFVGPLWVELVDVTDPSRSYRFTDPIGTSTIAFNELRTYVWYGETDGLFPDGTYRIEMRAREAGQSEAVPLHMKSTVTVQIGDVASGIENVRSDVRPTTPQRFTMDGRPIAAEAVVHGAYIEQGKVRVAK
jgi:hypothetical protein